MVVEPDVNVVVVTALLPKIPVTAVAMDVVQPDSLNNPKLVVEEASDSESVTAGVWLDPGDVGEIDV